MPINWTVKFEPTPVASSHIPATLPLSDLGLCPAPGDLLALAPGPNQTGKFLKVVDRRFDFANSVITLHVYPFSP